MLTVDLVFVVSDVPVPLEADQRLRVSWEQLQVKETKQTLSKVGNIFCHT